MVEEIVWNDAWWLEAAAKAGAGRAAMVSVGDIPFRAEFRAACEQNTCGCYGANWMCPPHIGGIEQLIGEARAFSRALVYQTVWQIEDSFDFEGMMRAADAHSGVAQRLHALLPTATLHLCAGACKLCERCAAKDAEPCRHPSRALASLESHGVAVSELAALCGLSYVNGANTVTYFGAALFGQEPKYPR